MLWCEVTKVLMMARLTISLSDERHCALREAAVKRSAAVIETNVVVAGLLTASAGSPTAWILDGMCRVAFPFLFSAVTRSGRAMIPQG